MRLRTTMHRLAELTSFREWNKKALRISSIAIPVLFQACFLFIRRKLQFVRSKLQRRCFLCQMVVLSSGDCDHSMKPVRYR
jgi:hypothetical protein